jgi:hypothetical protein
MKRAACLACALMLVGCGLTRPPELNVEDQWADAMRRLGLFSFYPATEDVLPGDIYLLVPPPYGADVWLRRQAESVIPGATPVFDPRRFSLLRLGSLAVERPEQARRRPLAAMSLREHLEEQQRERPRIQPPPAPDAAAAVARPPGAGGAPRASVTSGQGGAFPIGGADQNEIRTRLQRSAIPSLTVARVTETQLGAAGIFGNFGANLIGSAGGEVGLTIALRDVQELNIEAWRARTLFDSIGPAVFAQRIRPADLLYWLDVLRAGRSDRYSLIDPVCRGNDRHLRDQDVQVAVVTRVMYAGAIEYSFSQRVSAAVRAALDLQGALAQNIRQSPQIPTVTVNAGTPPPPPAGQQPPPPATPQDAARNELAGRLSGLTGITGGENARAGVRTSFGIGSLGSLSLIETFNRPVAVGAGSRLVMSFHDALAGPSYGATGARFLETVRFCEDRIGAPAMAAARDTLWNVMTPATGLPAPAGGGQDPNAERGPDPFQPDPPARAATAGARPVTPTPARDEPTAIPQRQLNRRAL